MEKDLISHRFVVRRIGGWAIVSIAVLCVIESYHTTRKEAWSALKRALTCWAENTNEGREAWHYSSEDFNIGDLSAYLGAESLSIILRNHNIADMTLEHFNEEGVKDYDEVLIDSSEINV